jgi:hypothetical protein
MGTVSSRDLQAAMHQRAGKAEKRLAGHRAREHGREFEKRIGAANRAYIAEGVAWIMQVPTPTTPCGRRHPTTGAPLLIYSGKPPFDLLGWTKDTVGQLELARTIGAELKHTDDDRLRMRADSTSGEGLQWHQLKALVDLADAGGIAVVLWHHQGEVGRLEIGREQNDTILSAFHALREFVRLEGAVPRGGASLPWAAFQKVKLAIHGGEFIFDWLEGLA